MTKLIFATLAALTINCNANDDVALLDHAQILAVRADPAHASPGARIRIDVLAGDDAGTVFEATPDTVSATGASVTREADGWYVTGAADTPSAPRVELAVTIDGTSWRADKQLVFADAAANPDVAAMSVAGNDEVTIECTTSTKLALGASAAGVEPLTYAWYTSIGKLEKSRSATPTFDGNDVGNGTVLLVVRDPQGGVAWLQRPAHVR